MKEKLNEGIRSGIVTQPANLLGKYKNIRFNAPFNTDKNHSTKFSPPQVNCIQMVKDVSTVLLLLHL